MNKIFCALVILILSANVLVFADDAEQVITLKDGSQIKGVLSGIQNGVYTVKTPIIGDVHVSANDVSSITNVNAPVATAPVANITSSPSSSTGSIPNMDQQVMANQQRLMANPQSMSILQEMTQDPEIMQALSDPSVVQAVTSHDYAAVQNNPKIKALMGNPKMQALLQQLAQQQQGSSSK